ncbi:glycosyltransferase family 39 protein [Nocardia nova]|uniref:glycosyltransferase family 39 protein n=1 Tax=Nocardia nova TaxID=37330 RepID=UPI001FE5CAC4
MWWIAAVFGIMLGACADRYGYHRDELYFLASGRHPAWGYPDQPPLTPMLARAMSALDPNSLVLLRVPAIVAATLVVLCAGWMAGEFGGRRAARALAAGTVAASELVMATGHLLSTATFDLAAWSVIVVLVLKVLRKHADPRWWLAIGPAVGIGVMNKALLVLPMTALVVALLMVGPRKVFATKYFPLAVGIALLMWLPYLWWQAQHGWPQWQLSRSIAGGSSGTSSTRAQFVLLQAGLMGPLLVPLWAFGWWRLWKQPRWRAVPVAYVLLFLALLVSGGKAYYLGGMYPVLESAAAVPVAGWLAAHRKYWPAAVSVVAVSALVAAVLFLPVLPAGAQRSAVLRAVNYDGAETIGWPTYVREIADARTRYAPTAELLTTNYGEAGAIERFGAPYGLPTPHSGHNSYWYWGPPPGSSQVLTIGLTRPTVERICVNPTPAGHLDNGLGIRNDEQYAALFVCAPRAPWSAIWPHLQGLG